MTDAVEKVGGILLTTKLSQFVIVDITNPGQTRQNCR
jgi:hypothetical protein